MYISPSIIPEVIKEWINREVLPQSTNTQKFLLNFMLLFKGDMIFSSLTKQYVNLLKEQNGLINIDKCYESASKALELSGNKIIIPFIEWEFDKNDLDCVYSIVKDKAVRNES